MHISDFSEKFLATEESSEAVEVCIFSFAGWIIRFGIAPIKWTGVEGMVDG